MPNGTIKKSVKGGGNMAGYNGCLVWRGSRGGGKAHSYNSRIQIFYAGITDFATFAVAIAPYSNCVLRSRTWSHTADVNLTAPAAGTIIDRKATIYMRDPETGRGVSFSFPDPVASICEIQSNGERIKQSDVESIVGLINTLTSHGYTALYGVVEQSR